MMQDPKTRQQAQDKLNEMAYKAQGQDKKDLQNAAKQAGDMANQTAGKEPGPKPEQKIDPKDQGRGRQAGERHREGEAGGSRPVRADDEGPQGRRRGPEATAADGRRTPRRRGTRRTRGRRRQAGGSWPRVISRKCDPKELATPPRSSPTVRRRKSRGRRTTQGNDEGPAKAEEAKKMLDEMAKTPNGRGQAGPGGCRQEAQLAKETGPKDKPAPKPKT